MKEPTEVVIARIDERTEAIRISVVGIKEHLRRQNDKLLEHESRLSIVEEQAENTEKLSIGTSKSIGGFMSRLLIGLLIALVASIGGVITGIAGIW